MENIAIKKEPIEDKLFSIIDVKEEKIDEIDQSNATEIASKNSEERNSFELKKETDDNYDHSKVKKKGRKSQKTEIICEICNKQQSSNTI